VTTTKTTPVEFPESYAVEFDPTAAKATMQLKGRDYMNVQNRMLWFIRDQRDFIRLRLATTSYCIQTELVELDRERGFAHFKTYIRDVLGNEATMYGSETAKDFGDYAEKASTKSVGRALLALGYGTAFAQDMDEGERVVDSPVERKAAPRKVAETPRSSAPEPLPSYQQHPPTPLDTGDEPRGEPGGGYPHRSVATDQQLHAIMRLCDSLGKSVPDEPMTVEYARSLISQLSAEYQQARRAG
jgi:hypothetical protein